MQQLIKNPIFRILGVIVILYYGLLHKETPDSLGNRLAPEKVKSNIQEMSNQSLNIIGNIKKAEEIQKTAGTAQKPPLQKNLENPDLKEIQNEQ